MAGRYTGSYLDRRNSWRALAILADTGGAERRLTSASATSINADDETSEIGATLLLEGHERVGAATFLLPPHETVVVAKATDPLAFLFV